MCDGWGERESLRQQPAHVFGLLLCSVRARTRTPSLVRTLSLSSCTGLFLVSLRGKEKWTNEIRRRQSAQNAHFFGGRGEGGGRLGGR